MRILEFCSNRTSSHVKARMILLKRHAQNISGKGSSILYQRCLAARNDVLTWNDELHVSLTHGSTGRILIVQQPT